MRVRQCEGLALPGRVPARVWSKRSPSDKGPMPTGQSLWPTLSAALVLRLMVLMGFGCTLHELYSMPHARHGALPGALERGFCRLWVEDVGKTYTEGLQTHDVKVLRAAQGPIQLVAYGQWTVTVACSLRPVGTPDLYDRLFLNVISVCVLLVPTVLHLHLC